MKPNKVKKDAPKAKVTSIKGGMIKKSHANKVPSALSAFKDPERALSLIQKAQEDGNVKMKVNKKKGQSQQGAKNENAASPKPVKSQGPIKAESKEPTANFKVTSKKNKQGGLVKTSNFTVSDSSPLGKAPGTKLKRKAKNAEEENNTSPVKVGQPVKKAKVPFNESLLTLDNTLEQELAPETLLGLQIEKALSPRSEKKKKKQLAKLQAQGKVEVSKPESSPSSSEKRRKRSKRRGKKHGANKEHAPLLEVENVKNALKALFKTAKASDKDLFGEDKFIYLQCNVLKGSEKTKAVLHIPLPHPILPESPEILFICPDLKGKRNEPDEAVDFYKELLSTKGIDYISEIIPIRRLKMDYSSFEQRKKLADRFDAVTVDGRVSLFARIGKRFAGTKACVASVNMEEKRNLKDEFDKAIKKVAFFSSGNGLSFSIKCGRNGMPMDKVAENIMCISQYLSNDRIIIGNPRNIASVYVKLALSKAFPVYVNTSPPNVVETPAGKVREEEEPVEDEVTTVFGGNVVVYPSGKVKVKKDKKAKKSPESEENQESPKPIEKKANKAETKKQKSKAKEESDEEESDEEEEDDDLSFDIASDYELSDGDKGELSDDEGSNDEEEEEDEDDDEKDEESDADDSDEEVSRVEEGSDDDDDEENEEESDDDVSENSDEFEDKIEAAEREYLQEVRDIQDEMSKNKKKLKKMVNDQKAMDNAEKAPQGKKIGKSNIPLKQQPQKNVPIQQKGSPKQNKKNANKKQGSILKEAAEKIKESNQKLQEKLGGPKKFGKPKEAPKPEGLANRKPFNRQDSKGGSPKQWKGQNKKQGNEPGNFQKKKPGNQGSPQQRNQGSPQQRNQKSKQQQQNGVSSLKNRKFENFNKGNKQNENKPQGEKRFKK